MTCQSLHLRPSYLYAISDVDHLDYGRLRGVRPEDWLDLLTNLPAVTTQPFSQFARYVASIGRPDLARAAQIRAERQRTSEVPRRSPERLRRCFGNGRSGTGTDRHARSYGSLSP